MLAWNSPDAIPAWLGTNDPADIDFKTKYAEYVLAAIGVTPSDLMPGDAPQVPPIATSCTPPASILPTTPRRRRSVSRVQAATASHGKRNSTSTRLRTFLRTPMCSESQSVSLTTRKMDGTDRSTGVLSPGQVSLRAATGSDPRLMQFATTGTPTIGRFRRRICHNATINASNSVRPPMETYV